MNLLKILSRINPFKYRPIQETHKLVCRKIFRKPVEIKNGETLKITYTIRGDN